ncbi:ABC transporter substrate-binding protein [Citricoccus alkalitolerans]|uniref:Thiamine pyrimidine synthase n=1 Tax=Citricoccus alkalitolerans TaxID=246603 RepID=A0ABV8XTN7_9MICC
MVDVAFLPKHAPFFSAAAQGFFEAEGISLEIMPGSGSNNTVTSVDTGRVDFGWADYGVTILNKGEGASVKQVNLVQGMSAYATLALPDSGISDWSDLKGKTVATEGAGAMTAMWPLAVEGAGLSESDVEVVHASGESKIPGLLANQWDANISLFVSDEPVLIGEGIEPVVLKWADVGVSYYGNGIVASEGTIEADSDLVSRFNHAMQQGYLWACQNPELAAADFMAEVPGFTAETVEAAIDGQCSLSWSPENEELGFGAMSDEGVQDFIDVAGDYLGLEDPEGLDPSSVYTNEFLMDIERGDEISLPQAN